MDQENRLDVEQMIELLEKHDFKKLKEELESVHPVDIVDALEELDKKQRILIFRLLAKEEAAEVFTDMNSDMREDLINALTDSELEEVMEEMYVDDTVDVLEEMPANVDGAFLIGKTWRIPENAEKPERSNKKKEQPITLLDILQEQKASKYSGGIYHKTQIDLTYNSNHIEGSRLTHDQTRYIFETNTIGVEKEVLNVDDVIETANHFRCIDMIIDNAKAVLTEKFIKELHLILKSGTSDSRKDWFAVGDYKKIPNEVGGMDTALPEEVADKMKTLLTEYNGKEEKNFEDILDFHVKFERIHPFQDGNGRVGRLIMFKECLKYNIIPFIIEDNLKMFYYRGLKEWNNEKGYLTDTCLTAQDKYKAYLDYFRIAY